MDTIGKLKTMATEMYLEPAEEVSVTGNGGEQTNTVAPCGQVIKAPTKQQRHKQALGISPATVSGGKTIPLLKTMLTSACERDCVYCPFRAGRNYRRVTFKPEEMAKTFMDMHRAGMVRGLFLSSGIIKGGATTQDKLIKTADILRHQHNFRGYIHLKLMPGAEKEQVARSMQLADRLSVNLEAPNPNRLQPLAPKKVFVEELLRPLQWVESIRREQAPNQSWNGRWPSTTTQVIVGGGSESDLEHLTTTDYLYKNLNLRRTYFSTFSPIRDTPLENQMAENPQRTRRLYQAAFLFRDYNFSVEDMPFDQNGRLPLHIDPKIAWADEHLRHDPVELNRADRHQLLQVPGIGPKIAQTLLKARRQATLSDLQHLRQLGIPTKRLTPFVLLDGKRPPQQLKLL